MPNLKTKSNKRGTLVPSGINCFDEGLMLETPASL